MEKKRKDCLFWKVIYCLFITHDVAKIIMDKNSYCIYSRTELGVTCNETGSWILDKTVN